MKRLTTILIASSAFGVTAFSSVLLAGNGDSTCPTTKSPNTLNASYEMPAQDIVDTAVAAGTFNTLAAALKAAGLADALKGEGPFTVFAPTDEAFSKLPKGTVEELLKPENKAKLQAILKYHVVKGSVGSEKVTGLKFAETLNGQRIDITINSEKVKLDGKSTVTAVDIQASNGVIHVIDTVLLPETKTVVEVAKDAKQFTTLLAAIDAAGLTSTLIGDGPFTILAPTDAAFSALPKGTVENLLKPENLATLQSILKYHVISGRVYSDQVVKLNSAKTLGGQTISISADANGVMINEATVAKVDIEAANGVIHVIDAVLIP
ncbi:MAG: fasciclin domain-containing protein [Phycisphaerales bacterium JB050]